MTTLDELGIAENTFIVYTSDNGPWLGKRHHGGSALPLRAGKGTTYEGGMREPCVIRWPARIKPGQVCQQVASTIDLLPTFARIVGAELPEERPIDGHDISALVDDPTAPSPHDTAGYFYYKNNKVEAIRMGKWKLHLKMPPELYDLRADIGETNNRAGAEPDIVASLRHFAARYDRDLKANSRPPWIAIEPGELHYVPKSTKKVCQLTGDFDRTAGVPTLSQTGKRFGVNASDLGSSFEHKGHLFFLFGDTWGRPGAWDALAWTKSADPGKIVLDFHRAQDGKWLPPTVPGLSQKAFEIPSGGISVTGTIYVVFTTDHTDDKVMGRSILAASRDDGQTFQALYEFSCDKFINVSFWTAGDWLYIYGSGEYRKSSVCLARIRPRELRDRSRLQFLAGIDENQEPRWSPTEKDAVPLFQHDVVGEFSVAYLEPCKRYVMLYNASEPRGITMRSARAPWGPWSDGTVVFHPWEDDGYGHFMHISAKYKKESDALSDPNREDEWGGAYGPYIMARFTTGADGKCRIYYTMSTWNPYQVVVMKSDLQLGIEVK
jgi:hypothetical protein